MGKHFAGLNSAPTVPRLRGLKSFNLHIIWGLHVQAMGRQPSQLAADDSSFSSTGRHESPGAAGESTGWAVEET